MNQRYFPLLLLPLLAAPAGAAERITLTPADCNRLGIEFAPVGRPGNGAGTVLPATVINSPEGPATLNLPFGGTLTRWLVDAGDPVRAGQPLAEIQSPEVLTAQQEWIQAITAEDVARAERDRTTRLLAEGIVSAQRQQQANRAHEQAAFQARAAAERLRRAGLDDAALVALRSTGTGIGSYPLTAPVAGRVVRRLLTAGEFAAAHAPAVRLRPGSTDWVRVRAPARLLSGLTPGQLLRVKGSGEVLTVRQRDRVVDEASQLADVLAEFTQESGFLAGQVIAVELPLPTTGVLVPRAAVSLDGEETSVFVRTPQGLELRRVNLVPVGTEYLAAAGLQAGEEIVVRGTALLKGINAGLGPNE